MSTVVRKDAKKKLKLKKLFVSFFLLMTFRLGGLGPYDCNFNAMCDVKILCAFLLVCCCLHAKATLMVLFRMLNM